MKKRKPKEILPDDLLKAARDHAHTLFQLAAGPTKGKVAARALVELALYATSLVDDLHLALNPESIHEESKYYEEFPILASGVRRANAFQLKRVYALPLGEYRPFKCGAKVGPAAKWSNVRDTIIRHAYPKFERIRNGRKEIDVSDALASRIRGLPSISLKTRWDWAELMAEYLHQGPGWKELVPLISASAKVKNRNFEKRRGRVISKHGGEKLYEEKGCNEGARFFATPSLPNQTRPELDFIEAQQLSDKSAVLKSSLLKLPSAVEELNAVKDALYDCLKSILKC